MYNSSLVLMFSLYVFVMLCSISRVTFNYFFFSVPVIPQTGLPGGTAGVGAGKKASKLPGFVVSTINSQNT